jgi:sugar-specific transcriptional regulator TrmB
MTAPRQPGEREAMFAEKWRWFLKEERAHDAFIAAVAELVEAARREGERELDIAARHAVLQGEEIARRKAAMDTARREREELRDLCEERSDEIIRLRAALAEERGLRVQLSDDSQRHLDRALEAEAALAQARAALDASRKIRAYVALVLADDEQADVQLAADRVKAALAQARAALVAEGHSQLCGVIIGDSTLCSKCRALLAPPEGENSPA